MAPKRKAQKAGFHNAQKSPHVRNKRERTAIYEDEDSEPENTKDPDFHHQ